jgi:hypothetical protein
VLASISDFTFLTDAEIAAQLDVVVNDLGFTRARVGLRSGVENPTGSYNGQYEIVNDNSNPNSINTSAFHFAEQLNVQMDRIVVPMRQRVLARGEQFYFNLEYVDFGASAFEHYDHPEEYAEFILAAYNHLQSRYGFIPDGIEIMLEPDNLLPNWNGTQIGQVMVATAAKLQANGYPVPDQPPTWAKSRHEQCSSEPIPRCWNTGVVGELLMVLAIRCCMKI